MKNLFPQGLMFLLFCTLSGHVFGNCFRVVGEAWSNQYNLPILQLETLPHCYGKPCGKKFYPVQATSYQVLDDEAAYNPYYEQIDFANGLPVVVKSNRLSLCRTMATPCYLSGPNSWCFLGTFTTSYHYDAEQYHWQLDGTGWSTTTSSPSVEINSLPFRPGTYTLRVRTSKVCYGTTFTSEWETRSVRVVSKVDPACDHGAPRKAAAAGRATETQLAAALAGEGLNRHYTADLVSGETAWLTNPHTFTLPVVLMMVDDSGTTFFETLELAPGATHAYRPADTVGSYLVVSMVNFLVAAGEDAMPVAVQVPERGVDAFVTRKKQGREVVQGLDVHGRGHGPLWNVVLDRDAGEPISQ
ncbi:hypothetical protein [Acanthopleuribacter pedis]|uniref:Uncharacterized protein n=1 Tax=Acanthopleuribacter pedis TaxID=442870 RepID=A0A8J7U436_9BACT|nr:hypothetical protein [Acanthopleuribacter pedis]MBO1319409.1 hypothetical protein [Acanthopleuribacter pedis]